MDDDNDVQMSGISITEPPSLAANTENNISSTKDAESKMEESKQSMLSAPSDPFDAVQSAMSAFLNEMTAADLKATELYQQQMERQQQLMSQFVADSLRAMHEFNTQLDPIHDVLKKLKKPLEDVLLSM